MVGKAVATLMRLEQNRGQLCKIHRCGRGCEHDDAVRSIAEIRRDLRAEWRAFEQAVMCHQDGAKQFPSKPRTAAFVAKGQAPSAGIGQPPVMLPCKERASADLRKCAVLVAQNAGNGDVAVGHHPQCCKIERAFQPCGQISNLGAGNPQNGDIGSFAHVRNPSIAIGGVDRLSDVPPAVFKVSDKVCKGAGSMAQPAATSVEYRCSALCSASIDGDDQGLAHAVLSLLAALPHWRLAKRN